jgi:hypothetical protein
MRRFSDEEAFHYIYALIDNQPYARYILQSILRSEFGFTLSRVTRFLASRLLLYKYVLRSPQYSNPLHYYYTKHVSKKKVANFIQWIAEKDSIFNIDLGDDGEQYVRHLFIKAGFKGVPHPKHLGKRYIGDIKPDLFFQARMPSGESLLVCIEVKNQREVWHLCGREDIFRKLIRDALSFGAQPVLVVAHIDEAALKFCQENGIVVLHLGCQIIPNKFKNRIHKIPGNVLGADEFLLVNSKHPFQHKISPRSEEHISIVKDHDFILGSHKIWNQNPVHVFGCEAPCFPST